MELSSEAVRLRVWAMWRTAVLASPVASVEGDRDEIRVSSVCAVCALPRGAAKADGQRVARNIKERYR